MEKVQIGTVLYENEDTTKIYNDFSEYFTVDNEDYLFEKYIICKEPSQELIKAIENYEEEIRIEVQKYNEVVTRIANKVYANLDDEKKAYIFDHPDSGSNHFGLGLYIRNHYIYNEEYEFDYYHPDHLSGDIVSKIASMIIDNYDFENPFYRLIYDGFSFPYLRRLYHTIFGEYPDEILRDYENLPDENNPEEMAVEKVKSKILYENRYEELIKKFRLSKKYCNEFKSFTDEYNENDSFKIIPYDIVILSSKSLDNKTRELWLNVLKFLLDEKPRLALEIPAFVFNQKDTVLLAVNAIGTSLKRFKRFNADDDVIRTALNDDGEAIQYVNKELRDNTEYVKLALSSKYGNALKMRCMISYRDNDEFVRIALATNGNNIRWASPRIKDDFETAVFAIKHQPAFEENRVAKCLSTRLKGSIELALIDINEGQAMIDNYSRKVRDSDKIAQALLASKNGKWQIHYMSKRIIEKYKCDE